MAKRSHRTGHGTGVRDYSINEDVRRMPYRDTLPQEGPETELRYRLGPGGVGWNETVDKRSAERRAWDERMAVLRKRMQANRDADAKKREDLRKAGINSRVSGQPMDSEGKPVQDPEQPAAQPAAQPAGPKNGTSQNKSAKDPPLTRREAKPPADPTVTPVRKPTTSGTVSIDGIPDLHQTETRGKLEAAALNKAAVLEANSNTARKNAAYNERRADRTRESQELRDRMERADDFEAWRKQRSDRIRQERADSRFKNRAMSNRDDWENLGREGSNRRDYTKAAKDETDEQFQAAVKERQGRVDALRKRLAEMTDTSLVRKGESTRYNAETGKMEVVGPDGKTVVADADKRTTSGIGDDGLSYANKVYANTPARLRQIQELQKLVGDGKNVTDAQIEGATKTLDKWQGEADAVGQRRAVQQKLRDTEQMWRLRHEYGMESSAFSDDTVRKFHERSQKSEREKILRDMDVASGQGDEAGRADRMSKNADNWMRLVKTGFDVDGTFKKAMADPANEAAFQEGVDSIAKDDPERADKLDQLRRRFVMNQAMADAGLKDKVLTGGDGSDEMMKPQGPDGTRRGPSLGQAMAKDLPGSQSATGMAAAGIIQTPNIVDALRARQTAQQPSESLESQVRTASQMAEERRLTGQDQGASQNVQNVSMTPGEIEAQETGGSPAGVQAPSKSDLLPRRRKPEETQQAAKGGNALRPRRRR